MGARLLVPVGLRDRLALPRRREEPRRAAGGRRSVHRPWLRNLGLLAVLLVLIRLGTVEAGTYDTDDRWRVAVSLLTGGILLVRVLRRGTVLSAAGIERRGTIDTRRVPWSAVSDISPQRDGGRGGSITVTLTDGSVLWSTGSGRRRGRPDLLATATAWHRHATGDASWARPANRPLVVLLGGGVMLVTAMAMASTHRDNRPVHRLGLPGDAPVDPNDLRIEIAVTTGLSILLAPVVAVALVGAIVRAVRPRVVQSRSASDATVSNGASGWSP